MAKLNSNTSIVTLTMANQSSKKFQNISADIPDRADKWIKLIIAIFALLAALFTMATAYLNYQAKKSEIAPIKTQSVVSDALLEDFIE